MVSDLNNNLIYESDGCIKLPFGNLIQWGRILFPGTASGGQGYGIINFNTPFISAPVMLAIPIYVSSLVVFVVSVQPRSDGKSAVVYARTLSGGIVTGAGAYWIALGKWK